MVGLPKARRACPKLSRDEEVEPRDQLKPMPSSRMGGKPVGSVRLIPTIMVVQILLTKFERFMLFFEHQMYEEKIG